LKTGKQGGRAKRRGRVYSSGLTSIARTMKKGTDGRQDLNQTLELNYPKKSGVDKESPTRRRGRGGQNKRQKKPTRNPSRKRRIRKDWQSGLSAPGVRKSKRRISKTPGGADRELKRMFAIELGKTKQGGKNQGKTSGNWQ